MHYKGFSRAAFTLIEMLVVTALIAILATVLVGGLRAARNQAQAALCQSHLRNLHQACMNYLSDTSGYPYAASHEYYRSTTGKYRHQPGWVSWLPKSKVRDTDPLPNPWAENNEVSHASKFYHVDWSGKDAVSSIRHGSIFPYTTKDEGTFFCKGFNGGKENMRRTYAMNYWFGSRRLPRYRPITPLRDFGSKKPSRMAYIVEMEYSQPFGQSKTGETGRHDKPESRTPLPGDSAWDYDKDAKPAEKIGFWHRKSGKLHSHVVFVDGHIESIVEGGSGGNLNAFLKDIGDGK